MIMQSNLESTSLPRQLIQHLVDKWQYDHNTLLIDESRNELDNFYYMGKMHPHKYGLSHQSSDGGGNKDFGGYIAQPQQQNAATDGRLLLPHPGDVFPPVYGPSLRSQPKPSLFNGERYIPPPPPTPQQIHPSNGTASTFQGYPDRRLPVPSFDIHPVNQLVSYKYTNKIPYVHSRYLQPPEFGPGQQYKTVESPRIKTYGRSEWFKRLNQNDKYLYNRRRRRSADMMYKLKRMATLNGFNSVHNATDRSGRHRRQAQGGNAGKAQNLCMSRSQYIMPRAALNNRGNWMYVVNMPEVDNRLTQLVKSETCVSQQCSGICTLPNGYTSRCEQKYVQKRLVALESGGNQLYTDVFWFPSCCICTITNN